MKKVVRLGLAAAVWFAALARAGHDLWAATVLFAWLTLLALLLLWDRGDGARPVEAPLAPPLLGWAAAAALSSLGAFDANTTFLEIRIQLFCLLFYFLFVNAVETAAERAQFFFAAGLSIVPVALIAGWQWATVPYDRGEFHATLINSSVMAGFSLCWIFFFGRRAAGRRLALAPFAAAVAALMIARSWWAYVSLGFGALVFFRSALRESARRHARVAALLASAAAAAVVAVVAYKLRLRTGAYVGVGRLYYWRAAVLMFLQNPWTGVGLGGYQAAYPYFRAGDGGVPGTLFAHDFPLQILAETGLVGAAAALVAGGSFWRRIRAAGRTQPADPDRDAWIATLAALLCFSLTSIFLEYFLSKLLLTALLASLVGVESSRGYRLRPLWSAAGAAALVLLSVFWLRPFVAGRLLEAGLVIEKEGDLARAETLFRDAASLDPTLADADWALYLLEKNRWNSGRSPQSLRSAQSALRGALLHKKSPLFEAEAARFFGERPLPP